MRGFTHCERTLLIFCAFKFLKKLFFLSFILSFHYRSWITFSFWWHFLRSPLFLCSMRAFFGHPCCHEKDSGEEGKKRTFAKLICCTHGSTYVRTCDWSLRLMTLLCFGVANEILSIVTLPKNYIWLVLRFFQEPAKRLRAYLVSKYFITKTRWRRCFYLRKLPPSKKTSNLFSSIFSRFYTVSVLCVLHDPNKSWLVTIFLPNERKRRRRRHEINKANWCNSYSFFFFPFSNFDNKKRPQPALSLLVILDSFLRHPSSL